MSEQLTPAEAQRVHEQRQHDNPGHDGIGCWCCCLDCDFDWEIITKRQEQHEQEGPENQHR
jgi:hypothetical protein